MFALASFLLFFIAADDAAATKPAVESCPVDVAQAVTRALDDFEAAYADLGLLGAAPMPGRELLPETQTETETEQVVSTYSAFDGSVRVAAEPQRFARNHRVR